MTKLTLGQAAKEANKAKATILDAIKNGRLSAQKGEKGQYEIDPAELFRVYLKTEQKPNGKTETEHLETDHKTALLLQKIDFLEQCLSNLKGERDNLRGERDRERKQLQETIDNLRNDHDRLLSVITEQAGAVKQLTYQPKTEPSQATIAWQWWLIFVFIASGACAWWAWH